MKTNINVFGLKKTGLSILFAIIAIISFPVNAVSQNLFTDPMGFMMNMVNNPPTPAPDQVYFNQQGSLISISPSLGLIYYNDKDHTYSYNCTQSKNGGQTIYRAKHGPIVITQSPDNQTITVKWDNSSNALTFNFVSGNVNDNRYRLKSVNHPLSRAMASTADANYNYEVAPYYNNGGSNNNNNSSGYNNMPTEREEVCSFCGGDGVSPLVKYTGTSGRQYCRKCGKVLTDHYHERCPNCKGTGRVKRLR